MAESQHSPPTALANKAARVAAIVKSESPIEEIEVTTDVAEAPANAATSTSADAPVDVPAMAGTTPSTSTSAPDPAARAAKHASIEEKLAVQREREQARKIAQRVLEERKAAEADRKVAAAERAKWESVGSDYNAGLRNLGLNPQEVLRDMVKQAQEAGTPEAQIKAVEAALKAEVDAKVAPLVETIEQLRAREAQYEKQARDSQIVSAFQTEIANPEYASLRIEYDDSDLLNTHVRRFAEDPESFYPIANKYNVQLKEPGGRFSMREVLQVLKAAQDAHERGKEPRRARLAPSTQSPADTQSAQPALTVNGTAARSNAGTTITNDLVSSRASAGPTRLSRKERVKALIDKDGRR